MANCSNCGKSVGCGCQLIGGLCTTCHNAGKPKAEVKVTPSKINKPKAVVREDDYSDRKSRSSSSIYSSPKISLGIFR